MNIYPAILTDSLEVADQQLSLVGQTDLQVVQIDIIDGNFADNVTFTPIDTLELQNLNSLEVDFHLMTDEPMDDFLEIDQVKSQVNVRTVIAQVEKMSYQFDFVSQVKKSGLRVGLSLDLFTPIEAIEQESWHQLDVIQLMAIEAGFQGESLNERIFDKISSLATMISTRKQKIELIVDGGVKLSNYQQIISAGADSVAVGSQIWTATEPLSIINQFK